MKYPVAEGDWTRGRAEAPVTLVEYVDFQCPCCQGSYPAVEGVIASSGEAVRFAVRHFPVSSAHEYAQGAALAAEAAGRQGKFWEMYRRLLTARGQLGPAFLERYARELGLDLEAFRRDSQDEAAAAKIREQKHHGLRDGVNGTPTLFINGARYDLPSCPVREEELRGVIAEARAEAEGRRAA